MSDLEDFIDDKNEDKKYVDKHKYHYAEDEAPQQPKKLEEYFVHKPGVQKKNQGISLDIEVEPVPEPIAVKITEVVSNQAELKEKIFDDLLVEQKQKLDDLDLDELDELMSAPKSKKPVAVHRKTQIQVPQSIPHLHSTITEDMLKDKKQSEISQILEQNNSILFYYIDIYEDQYNYPGEIFLFGKVLNRAKNIFETCTLLFPDQRKTVYLLYEGEPSEQELQVELEKLVKKYLGLNSNDYSYKVVQKKYAFELNEVPIDSHNYVELKYSQKNKQQLPLRISYSIFKAALQTTMSTIEQFLIQNGIRGPSWLVIKQCEITQIYAAKTTSKHCLSVSKFGVMPNQDSKPNPSLKVLSIAIKTCTVEKQEEIIAISLYFQDNISMDGADNKPGNYNRTIIRMPNDAPWPIGYRKQFTEVDSEKALLESFLNQVELIDPDMIVGHDLSNSQLILIINRIQKLRVQSWNKLSRLQRITYIPKSANKTRVLTLGRLLVDTYLQAKELIKSNDYSLSWLSEKYLNVKHVVIESDVIKQYTEDSGSISYLVSSNELEASYTLQIMLKLQVISLTKQLTNIAGNTWTRSLQNQRAERNEMLLMHFFYEQGYILPDKLANQEKEENEEDKEKDKKKTYQGGLVFEPKSDLYNNYVLLLDFNSLYPSIIMEYNICFTTVQRTKISIEDLKSVESEIGKVADDSEPGILPKVISGLINSRANARKRMKNSKGIEQQIWNIRQLAIKLVANSMYGCLGFKSSRFYAAGIASLITSQGREILMKSKEWVERQHTVIYGDTDSMMICPRLQQDPTVEDVLRVGKQLVKDIGNQYKNGKLTLGIDGLFKCLLLLKKKKYAAIKVSNLDELIENPRAEVKTELETKGIDLVRREYCPFSKFVQKQCLNIILYTQVKDDMFEDIYKLLEEVHDICLNRETAQEQIQTNKFIKEDFKQFSFIITKQLSKAPHEYGDAANHPHVQIAKRLIQNGRSAQSLINHFIYYVIIDDPTMKQLALRAYTPEEQKDKQLPIDYHYYLQSQIFDPIERLCKNINGLLLGRCAEILGLNSNKYAEKIQHFSLTEKISVTENFYLKPLKIKCPNCESDLPCDQIYDQLYNSTKKEFKSNQAFCTCKENIHDLKNSIRTLIRNLIRNYYRNLVLCKANLDKKPSLCYSINGQCFGTCCEKNRSNLRSAVEEYYINEQVRLLTMMYNQVESVKKNTITISQPFLTIKLENLFRFLKVAQ